MMKFAGFQPTLFEFLEQLAGNRISARELRAKKP
jgi:hypothetical protein